MGMVMGMAMGNEMWVRPEWEIGRMESGGDFEVREGQLQAEMHRMRPGLNQIECH